MTDMRLFRLVIPRFPAANIYSRIAPTTTALGPIMIATAVAGLADWTVEVIDENNYHAPGPRGDDRLADHAALQRARPADVVGFYGGLTSTIPRLYALAQFYRQRGCWTIGGGQYLDLAPDEALANGLDVVVHGEGDATIIELLTAHLNGLPVQQVRGISVLEDGLRCATAPRPVNANLDGLPTPDFSLMRFARLSLYPVSRIRGCGMACEFCTVRGQPRCAAPECLLDTVSHLIETRGARDFFIVDDHFAQDRDQTLAFCRLLADYRRRRGIRLFITVQVRLECGSDRELLDAMYDAGIRMAAVGIESPIDEELRAMNKRLQATQMVDLVHQFHTAGMMVHGMFIFGYPLRTPAAVTMPIQERLRAYRRFFKQSRIDSIQIMLPIPLPGTPFRKRMASAGRLVDSKLVNWQHYDGTNPLIVPDAPLTTADLHRAQIGLMTGFYRFSAIVGLSWHVARLPLALLPLPGLPGRWRSWRRKLRNRLLACAGSFCIARWRREFRTGPFPHLLGMQTSRS